MKLRRKGSCSEDTADTRTVKTFEDYEKFSPRGHIKQGHLHDPFLPPKDVRRKLDEIKG